jgi:hypothetical protein
MKHLFNPKWLFVLLAVALLVAGAALALRPQASSADDITADYAWKQLPIGGGGWVTGMAMHPTTPGLVYGRTDVGGLFKWNPATQDWTQLINASTVYSATLGNGDYNIESIALAATNDQIVYIATNGNGGRILKSTDQGATWTQPSPQNWLISGNGEFRMNGERLAVDPANENVVYFGTRQDGLWRTFDGGLAWTLVPTSTVPAMMGTDGNAAGVRWVLFDPNGGITDTLGITQTNRIFAGSSGYGVYRSDDAGVTWTRIYTTTGNAVTAKMGGDYLYALLDDHFRKYDPATDTWTSIRYVGGWGAIVIDSKNPDLMFVSDDHLASGHLWRSTDGGVTWSAALDLSFDPADCDPEWICNTDIANWLGIGDWAFDPVEDKIWLTEGMGFWFMEDILGDTITMKFRSRGIEEMVPADIIAPPGGVPVVTTMDRQGFYKADVDGYPTRSLVDGEFYTGSTLDYAGQSANNLVVTLVKTNIWPWNGTAAYSDDGGLSWTRFPMLPDVNKGGNIAISASNPQNIVWLPSTNTPGDAGAAPYVTFDRGLTWQETTGIDPNLSLHELVWWVSKRALDSDKVTDGVFYLMAGHVEPSDTISGTFYVSTDGGLNWSPAPYAPPCSGTAQTDCHVWGQIRAVPGFAGHVWASTVKQGLWYTTDGGQSAWQQIAGVERAQAFGFGKALPGQSYPAIYLYGIIGGQEGYWRSGDMGVTWDYIAEFPNDNYDENRTLNGDMNIAGRVYIGTGGSSFVYGDDTTILPDVPSAPNLIEAVSGDGKVALRWGETVGATSYKVTYGLASGDYTEEIIVGDQITYTVSGLSNNTAYYFAVRATNAQGDSEPSNELMAVPSKYAPAAPYLYEPVLGDRQIELSWQPVPGAQGYKVFYGRSGLYNLSKDVKTATTTVMDELRNGAIYNFIVVGYNVNGEGDPSNERIASPNGEMVPQVTASYFDTLLSVDGVLDEAFWDLSIPLTKTVVGAVAATAQTGIAWNDEYFVVGFEVLDADLWNDSAPSHEDDAVEIYFDGDDSKGAAYDAFDRQIIKGWNDADIAVYHGNADDVVQAWSPITDTDGVTVLGYAVEVAIKWANVGVTPANLYQVGFDVGLDDDVDGGNREGQNVAYGVADNWQDTTFFGDVTLIGKPAGRALALAAPQAANTVVGYLYKDGPFPPFGGGYLWNNIGSYDLYYTGNVHGGTQAISVTLPTWWGDGFGMWSTAPLSTAGATHLTMWVNGGDTDRTIWFNVNGPVTGEAQVQAFANTWTKVEVPLSALNNITEIGTINFANAGGWSSTFYLDDIALEAFIAEMDVTLAGTGEGVVSSSGGEINCGITCTAALTPGSVITLTATVGENSTFTGWRGACNGLAETCILTLAQSASTTASFSRNQVMVSQSGLGSGTVTSDPAGVACGADCDETFAASTALTLTAQADAHSAFVGWQGGWCSGSDDCALTLDRWIYVGAAFDALPPVTYTLTVSKTGAGAGSITSIPAGIDCGAACSADFTEGTVVTLTATADAASTFTGWSGACTGSGTCVVTMDAAKQVTANFDLAEIIHKVYLPVIFK